MDGIVVDAGLLLVTNTQTIVCGRTKHRQDAKRRRSSQTEGRRMKENLYFL